MKYYIQQNDADHLIVLFHGTGGNELQMLPLAGELFPEADVISFAGEHAQNRYFPPLTNGVMDRAAFDASVSQFIDQWNELNLTYDKVTILGYSNGANFIIGLLEKGFPAADAILLHPSDLNYDFSAALLSTRIVMTIGTNDMMVRYEDAVRLAEQMKSRFEHVELIELNSGHEITAIELNRLKEVI